MENFNLLIFLLSGFLVLIWAVSDFLSEIPYRWGKPGKYKLKDSKLGLMIQNSAWMMGTLPSDRGKFWNAFHKATFKIFFDANHFFRNLPRILLSIMLGVLIHWAVGLVSLFFWYIGREIIFGMLLEKRADEWFLSVIPKLLK